MQKFFGMSQEDELAMFENAARSTSLAMQQQSQQAFANNVAFNDFVSDSGDIDLTSFREALISALQTPPPSLDPPVTKPTIATTPTSKATNPTTRAAIVGRPQRKIRRGKHFSSVHSEIIQRGRRPTARLAQGAVWYRTF